jgi:hypothetical protein
LGQDRLERSNERALDIFRENLGRYMEGRPLMNVVDPVRGY